MPRGEQVVSEPWRAHDPRESDWHCDHCEESNYGEPECTACQRPRELDADEQQKLAISQQTGGNLCNHVLLCEALPEYIGEKFDATDECFRQWQNQRTQRLKVGGQTKYLLVAMDEQNEWMREQLASECKCPPKEFHFVNKRTLDEISNEVMSQEFGIALQSEEEEETA